jgi:hypothetical protein
MMKKAVKKRWVEALESGKFRQGHSQFAQRDESKHIKYCCLGVLNKIENLSYSGSCRAFPEDKIPFGLTDDQQWTLIEMNDRGDSFKEIAAYIKKEL